MLCHRESFCPRFKAMPGLAGLIGALILLPSVPALSEPAVHGLTFEPRAFGSRLLPQLPPPVNFPIQLVLDDDSAEGVFGFAGGTARQFLWLNRFANPGPFALQEIWVLFPAAPDVPLGGAVQLVVFLDPDGDPSTGAQLLAAFDVMIQANDGITFSAYQLPGQLSIKDAGDVLIGVVNRFFTTGVDPPPTLPAALDETTSQDRSYFALWTGDPPDPPDLGTAAVVEVLDGLISGNFLIRGFGAPIPPPITDIPTVEATGLAVLGTLLALAGAVVLARRRYSSS